MTCIVGIEHDGHVTIGGDSLGISGYDQLTRSDKKVFRHSNGFIIGFTTSFRLGQILEYCFDPPSQEYDETDYKYLVGTFTVCMRDTFEANGVDVKAENSGCEFILAYRNKLYLTASDYQVGIPNSSFAAVGIGRQPALGALYALQDSNLSAKEKVLLALQAASEFSTCVSPPFHVLSTAD